MRASTFRADSFRSGGFERLRRDPRTHLICRLLDVRRKHSRPARAQRHVRSLAVLASNRYYDRCRLDLRGRGDVLGAARPFAAAWDVVVPDLCHWDAPFEMVVEGGCRLAEMIFADV